MVGTTPPTIHEPPSAPISNRIITADTLEIFLVIAASKLRHGTRAYTVAMMQLTADDANSTT